MLYYSKKKVFGNRYDGLVYSAGIREICSFDELSFQEWRKVFNINVDSLFKVTKALKKNIKRGGSVVTLSSVSGVLTEMLMWQVNTLLSD